MWECVCELLRVWICVFLRFRFVYRHLSSQGRWPQLHPLCSVPLPPWCPRPPGLGTDGAPSASQVLETSRARQSASPTPELNNPSPWSQTPPCLIPTHHASGVPPPKSIWVETGPPETTSTAQRLPEGFQRASPKLVPLPCPACPAENPIETWPRPSSCSCFCLLTQTWCFPVGPCVAWHAPFSRASIK